MDSQQDPELKPDLTVEKAMVGYESAVALWIYEGEMAWQKYNAMLVVNSIILAVIGLFSDSSSPSPGVLLFGLPAIGLILCLVWYGLTTQAFENHYYFLYSARELEERYLSPPVQTVSRGGDYSKGRAELMINGSPMVLRRGPVARLFHGSQMAYVPILAFAVLYVAFLVISSIH